MVTAGGGSVASPATKLQPISETLKPIKLDKDMKKTSALHAFFRKTAQSSTAPTSTAKLLEHLEAARKRVQANADAASGVVAKMKALPPLKKMSHMARLGFMAKFAEMSKKLPFGEGISMEHGAKRIAQQTAKMKDRVLAKTKGLSQAGVSPSDIFAKFRMENPRQARRSQKLTRMMAGSSGLADALAKAKAMASQ
jgi:hypothetical protein